MSVKLSVVIPTYNRAIILCHCIDRLVVELNKLDIKYEVVVSDNGSPDNIEDLLKHRIHEGLPIRYHRRTRNDGPLLNYINAYRRSVGEYLVWLADDDALDGERLASHLRTLDSDGGLVGIYTDWIAYDDRAERILHRYWTVCEPTEFLPSDKVDMILFVLRNQLFVEQGVFRRQALVNTYVPYSYGFPYYYWLDNLSDLGKIRFDPTPFYRENRVLKEGLDRGGHWSNSDIAMQLIGDQLRIALENLGRWALSDRGGKEGIVVTREYLNELIESWLHGRTILEINRAVARRDWICAFELRKRVLGRFRTDGAAGEARDFWNITVPAALQAIWQCQAAMECNGRVCFAGRLASRVATLFKQQFPEAKSSHADLATALKQNDTFVVVIPDSAQEVDRWPYLPGHVANLDLLLWQYRLTKSGRPFGFSESLQADERH